MTAKRIYRVTVKMQREYLATTHIRASSQAEADRKALKAYYEWDGLEDFPPSWCEHEPIGHDAEIDMRCRCVDCGEDKEGEYYMVADEVWAASGLGKNDGLAVWSGALAASWFRKILRRFGRPMQRGSGILRREPAASPNRSR